MMLYDPLWLRMLTPDARAEVVRWLEVHKIDTQFCAQFQTVRGDVIDSRVVLCQMYDKNERGEAYLDPKTREPVMGGVDDFKCKLIDMPTAVRARETA